MATAKANKVSQTATAQPKTVELYRLWEVSNRLGYSHSQLSQWHKDPEISTPAPAFMIGDTEHWTEDSFPLWKELVDNEIKRVAETGHTLEEMVDRIVKMAQNVNRRATYARPRQRGGYSKSAVTEAISNVRAVAAFVATLSDTSQLEPAEKRVEILKNLREAEDRLARL